MRHPLERLDRRVEARDHPAEIRGALRGRLGELAGERPQVAARHEVLAGAADDDDVQAVVGGDIGGGVDQRVHQREIERVQRLGSIERERGDRAVADEEDRR